MGCCDGMVSFDVLTISVSRRGMALYAGKNVAKLKGKGGKWKYMTEQEMLDVAEQFSPYR